MPLLHQPLPLETWLSTEKQRLSKRVQQAQQQADELAAAMQMTQVGRSKPAGPHDLLKHFIAAEIRMRQLLLSHPAPLMIVDQQKKILLTNVAAKQLLAGLGYSFHQAQPSYPCFGELFPEFDPSQEIELQVDPSYKASGRVVLAVRETLIQWQQSQARLLLFHDVSLEAEARHKLQEALASLGEINRMKSEFMSMATHEFRTPLAGIYSSLQLMEGYSQKLQQEYTSPWLDQINKHLVRSREAVDRLDQLVQEMLTLAKTQAGRTLFQPQAQPVVALVAQILEPLQSLAEKKGQRLELNAEVEQDFRVALDAQLVQHILVNLVSNALRFSNRGQKVQLHIAVQDRYLSLAVKDRGRGIPEQDLSRLGEPFFRASNVDAIQGTGLGLAIVKHYVELHQGQLEIQSRLGHGSCFQVKLPLQPEVRGESHEHQLTSG